MSKELKIQGWLFGYGVHKIHYFINDIALCGKVRMGQQSIRGVRLCKPINLDEKDSRACRRCKFMLNTYSDMRNKL